jgi:DNA-damage-inducible protein J
MGVIIMSNNVLSISFNIDPEIKTQADMLFAELGLNMDIAFNIFLRQAIRESGIPFRITAHTPNIETIAAMLEAEKIANDPYVKRYSDVEDALHELKS